MTTSTDNRTLSIERILNAPRQLVWDAWTQSDHIASWWGPGNMVTIIEELDFRIGGKWKFSMTMPDGNEFISEGEYLEIVEPEKIVTTADFKPMTEGVTLTAKFEEMGGKTRFIFMVTHPTEEYCKQQQEMGFMNGWGSVFDNLEKYLSSIAG